VFTAKKIVGEIQRSEHVERTADDADQRERVPGDGHVAFSAEAEGTVSGRECKGEGSGGVPWKKGNLQGAFM
jgi:hypothetical protein